MLRSTRRFRTLSTSSWVSLSEKPIGESCEFNSVRQSCEGGLSSTNCEPFKRRKTSSSSSFVNAPGVLPFKISYRARPLSDTIMGKTIWPTKTEKAAHSSLYSPALAVRNPRFRNRPFCTSSQTSATSSSAIIRSLFICCCIHCSLCPDYPAWIDLLLLQVFSHNTSVGGCRAEGRNSATILGCCSTSVIRKRARGERVVKHCPLQLPAN